MPLLLSTLPCEYQNITDRANALQIGISKTHLIYCKEKTKTCWRCDVCDEPKTVHEIPLDKISDVVVKEPAGGCFPKETLYHVIIQTPGFSDPEPEITVTGLSKEDAYKLRSLIMKREAKNKPDLMQRN